MTETSFTVYIVAALALHLVPLFAVDPEPETLALETDTDGGCFRSCDCECEDVEDNVDPQLSREQAIEMARCAGFLGPPRAECCNAGDPVWRVEQSPLLPEKRGLSAPAVVDVGRPTLAGPLNRAVVRRYAMRHTRELAACVEPATTTSATMHFLITPSGRVTSVYTLGEPSRRCLEDVVSKIVFPSSKQSTQVHLPLVLVREHLRYGTLADSCEGRVSKRRRGPHDD